MHRFLLPDIGEGLEEAEIVEWYVAVGDEISRDQPLVEVLTDKASTELPAPVSGIISSLGGEAGDVLRIGAVLVEIDDGSVDATTSEQPADDEPVDEPAPAPTLASVPTDEAPTAAPNASTPRPKAAPATRRLALELGIALTDVVGSGPGGRITPEDVSRHAENKRAQPAVQPRRTTVPIVAPTLGQIEPGRHPLRGIRRATAEHMSDAWSTIPHIHVFDDIIAGPLLELRSGLRSAAGERASALTALAFAAVASARALRQYPMVNAAIVDEQIAAPDAVNIGIAVSTARGLLVPVVKDADQLDLFAMSQHIAQLAQSARNGALTAEQLRGGSFTITNYGAFGSRYAFPIIQRGQSAILGLGAIREQPVAVDGAVVAEPTLPLVLGADHRLIDGDLASAFFGHLVASLSEPLTLLVGD